MQKLKLTGGLLVLTLMVPAAWASKNDDFAKTCSDYHGGYKADASGFQIPEEKTASVGVLACRLPGEVEEWNRYYGSTFGPIPVYEPVAIVAAFQKACTEGRKLYVTGSESFTLDNGRGEGMGFLTFICY